MSEDVWPKVGAASGIVAAVLLIVSFFLTGEPPGFDESAAEVQSFVQDSRGELQAAIAFGFAALAAFLWFLGSVYFRLRATEPAPPRLSIAALAGGVTVAAGGAIASAAEGASVYHSETLDPNSVQALWDLSVFSYLFVLVGIAVLTAATGVLAMRLSAIPRVVGAYSLLTAAYVFIVGVIMTFTETGAFSPSDGALGGIAFLLFVIWLIAMSVALIRDPRGPLTTRREPARRPEPMGPPE